MRLEVIERVMTERGELQLQRRGDAYEVIANGCFLMATYNGGSERALIDLAAPLVPAPGPRRVLVGGLGVGYTLRAALDLPGVEQVVVVEIEPKVVEWNRSLLAPFNGGALTDPRVRMVCGDFAAFLGGEVAERFDIIALDTDNGPDWTVFDQNQSLWGEEALGLLDGRRQPGGVLSFWSAHAVPAFEALLRRRFRQVRAAPVPAALGGVDDLVYLAWQ